MNADIKISSESYDIDLCRPCNISIPLLFYGEQPNSYNVPSATARPYQDDHFVGDTRKGGSCNFEEYRLIPHCNGTHTECVGHISYERISIHHILKPGLIPATLITVKPVSAFDTKDRCHPSKNKEDRLITQEVLMQALQDRSEPFLEALIIRTLPNSRDKMRRNYLQEPPPYFSIEAIKQIKNIGIRHLLVDMPSIDRMFDAGKLTAHHIFWEVPAESHEVDPDRHSLNTITEMIYVPDETADGAFMLDLQIPSFVADAAPSRPIIYRVRSH